MITPRTGRFLASLGVLTAGLVIMQRLFGGNIGLWVALGFGFWFLVRNELEDILARPFEWATRLLVGE